MKARVIFLLILVASCCFASEDTVRFTRSFKEGDVDRFKAKLSMSLNGAQAETEMEFKQTVKKVFPDAEADVETTFTSLKFKVAGTVMATPLPASLLQHFSKVGVPIGNPTGGQGQMMSVVYSNLVGMVMDRMFSVNKEYPLELVDTKDPKNRIKATVKVESIVKGLATLFGHFSVWNDKAVSKPINVSMTMTMDIASSKPNKLSGLMTDIPSLEGSAIIDQIKFTIERLKK
jgi:hypothetical protein